jgi:hypothetical protein
VWLVLLYPEPKREMHSELRNTTGRLGFDKTRLSQARSRLLARAGARGANLFLNLILDRHAQRVVVLDPAISSQLIRKHLEVVGIADLFAAVNVDQNFHFGLVISWRPVLTGKSAPVLLRRANDLLFRASGPGQMAIAVLAQDSVTQCHRRHQRQYSRKRRIAAGSLVAPPFPIEER